jgi:hypothetical protein
MKSSKMSSSTKIELKSKLRSLSISQIRDMKLGKFLTGENQVLSLIGGKTNEYTPKSSRKFSKDSLSPGYRRKVKTIIHKSSPLNHEDIQVRIPSKPNLLDSAQSNTFTKTLRNAYIPQSKPPNLTFENLKKTLKPANFTITESKTPKTPKNQSNPPNFSEFIQTDVLSKVKASFLQFRNRHFSILKEFN